MSGRDQTTVLPSLSWTTRSREEFLSMPDNGMHSMIPMKDVSGSQVPHDLPILASSSLLVISLSFNSNDDDLSCCLLEVTRHEEVTEQ